MKNFKSDQERCSRMAGTMRVEKLPYATQTLPSDDRSQSSEEILTLG